MENGSPGDFLKSVYCLLIMQMEVCRLFTKKQMEVIRLQTD
jgi:hypothetical protein